MQVTINLNIDDRYINFFKKVFTKRKAVLALLVAVLATNLNADSITKLNTFRGGDTIIASQVNDNFDQLFTKVNELDAFGHWSVSSGNIYYNGGNVGIGTASPGAKIEIDIPNDSIGGLKISDGGQVVAELLDGSSTNDIGRLFLYSGGIKNVDISGDEGVDTYFNAGNVGIGTTTPGYLLQVGNSGDTTEARANAWTTPSDIRLKTDISRIPEALSKISGINGYYYNWIQGVDKSRQVGVLSQEIEKVLPEIVSEDSEGYKSLDYSKLAPLFIEAIKEQQKIIDSQQTAINNLKARIEALEAPIIAKSRSNTSIKTRK